MEFPKDLQFFQKIDLPDGTVTPGTADHRSQPAYLGLEGASLLHGARVLDVAANDGFWSFWAEQNGASEVLAIDVERYEDYDWGYNGPPVGLQTPENEEKDRAFFFVKGVLDSQVTRQHASVYDLDPERHGQFDLVMVYGLLYHLRHPLLAIDRLRAVTKGACIIETHTLYASCNVPMTVFYEDDVCEGSLTNWHGPTLSCVAHWLKSAGFSGIYVEKNPPRDRQRAIGTVDPAWNAVFDASPNFVRCDEAYFLEARRNLENALTGYGKLRVVLRRNVLTPGKVIARIQRAITGKRTS